MKSTLWGRVRGSALAASIFGSNEEQPAALNNRGEVLMAAALPPKSEVVRMGGSYGAMIPTGSAFATVAAWPTTRAELILLNGEPAGGKSYLIDTVTFATIVTETAATEVCLIGQILSPKLLQAGTKPVDNAAILRWSKSGRNVSGSNAQLSLGQTTSGQLANQWFVLTGSPLGGASVSLGQAVQAEVNGGIIIPPGAALALNVVVGTAVAATGILGVDWHEVVLDVAA